VTYELEEIENKIIIYLNNSVENKILCEEPAEFFTKIIEERISVGQVERALSRLEKNNIISVNLLQSQSKEQNLKTIELI